jgi:hypothetical protein
MTEISDDDLSKLVVAADEEAFREGAAPKARPFSVGRKVMHRLGYSNYVVMDGKNLHPLLRRILNLHATMYRTRDLAAGRLHAGIFMFRDVFVRIDIPLMFGENLSPFRLTNLTPKQIQLLSSRPGDMGIFVDQFIDIFDFAGGILNMGDYRTPPEDAFALLPARSGRAPGRCCHPEWRL